MKSKDIIKALQKEDPTGETHVRFPDGELLFFETKEGYYDGAYMYKNEEGKFVITTKGFKIDAYFEDVEDIVWELEGDLEKIEDKLILDSPEQKKDYMEKVVKPMANKAKAFHKSSLAEFTCDVINKVIKEGYIITQPLDECIGRYNCMYYEKGSEKKHLRQGDCGAVLKSGLFIHRKDETKKCYVWELLNYSKEAL